MRSNANSEKRDLAHLIIGQILQVNKNSKLTDAIYNDLAYIIIGWILFKS